MNRVARAVLGIATAIPALAGCSAGQEDPVAASYVVAFPSVAAAVATDTVTIAVYDATAPDVCQQLFLETRSNQELPAPLATSGPVDTCRLLGGGGSIEVGYGRRAFLVTGTRQGKGFLLGCATADVFASTPPLDISLTLIDEKQSIPKTSCVLLSDACRGPC